MGLDLDIFSQFSGFIIGSARGIYAHGVPIPAKLWPECSYCGNPNIVTTGGGFHAVLYVGLLKLDVGGTAVLSVVSFIAATVITVRWRVGVVSGGKS